MKGFTLTELIVALVITTVVVVATLPFVLIMIDNEERNKLEQEAYSLIKTAENKCLQNKTNGLEQETWVRYENGILFGDRVFYNAPRPKTGLIKVMPDCTVSMAIHNGKWCVQKKFVEVNIRLTDKEPIECNLEIGAYVDVKYIEELIVAGYIPIANAEELSQINQEKSMTYGHGTYWEDTYIGGLDKKYVQTNHIDFEAFSKWNAIGDKDNPFTGIYVGNNLDVINFKIKNNKSYQGLFGYLKDAEIYQVNIKEAEIEGERILGILSGFSENSLVREVRVTGEMNGTSEMGCLIGINQGHIINSSSRCRITSNDNDAIAGGLVAVNSGEIDFSRATGIILQSAIGGGLVGELQGGYIRNCYATTSVQAKNESGGLVGIISGDSLIEKCYSVGKVEGENNIGGLVASKSGDFKGKIIYSYYDQAIVKKHNHLGEPLNETDLKQGKSYYNWNFDEVWRIDENNNNGYPFLIMNQ